MINLSSQYKQQSFLQLASCIWDQESILQTVASPYNESHEVSLLCYNFFALVKGKPNLISLQKRQVLYWGAHLNFLTV